jgi:hypothetical protein
MMAAGNTAAGYLGPTVAAASNFAVVVVLKSVTNV